MACSIQVGIILITGHDVSRSAGKAVMGENMLVSGQDKPAFFVSALLQTRLVQELSAGNAVADSGPGWGEIVQLVILQQPFKLEPPTAESGLVLREVNDPHYWLAEIEDPMTHELLACRS